MSRRRLPQSNRREYITPRKHPRMLLAPLLARHLERPPDRSQGRPSCTAPAHLPVLVRWSDFPTFDLAPAAARPKMRCLTPQLLAAATLASCLTGMPGTAFARIVRYEPREPL